jgi:hypothetical protein
MGCPGGAISLSHKGQTLSLRLGGGPLNGALKGHAHTVTRRLRRDCTPRRDPGIERWEMRPARVDKAERIATRWGGGTKAG